MNIRILKLLNGQELIGDVTETDKGFKVQNPMLVHLAEDPSGKPGSLNVHIIPYIHLAKKTEVEIVLSSLAVMPYEPVDQLEEKYRRHFGGIIIPKLTSI